MRSRLGRFVRPPKFVEAAGVLLVCTLAEIAEIWGFVMLWFFMSFIGLGLFMIVGPYLSGCRKSRERRKGIPR